MRKFFYTIITLLLINLVSCTNEYIDTIELNSTDRVGATKSNSSVLEDIQKYVNNKMSKGAATRSQQKVSFVPYTLAGDTALYIVNYADGWDIMSTDQRTPMVMMSSESGQLDMNDTNLPDPIKAYIGSIASEIHQLKQIENVNNDIHPEWIKLPTSENLLALKEETNNRDGLEPGVGYWEYLYSTIISENTTYESPRYIETKWDQEAPFNQYIPYSLSGGTYVSSPAGCGAVASSQYLYFMHYKNGIPSTTVSTATLINSTTNNYTFSNKNSSVWSQMAKLGNESSSKVGKSAMFIAYVAQQINTEYHPNGSSSDMVDVCSYISNETGISHSYVDLNYSYVINQLRYNQTPVILSANSSNANNSHGHSFIADQITEKSIIYRDYYGWVGTTSTGENANYIDESNGHIIGYKIKKQEIRGPVAEYRLKMNWGYAGDFDDVVCNATAISDWQANYYQWNYQRKMLRRN